MQHTAHTRPAIDLPLASGGMAAVMLAQFLSALADNAILIAAIAIVKAQGRMDFVPLLQEAFVVPFIALAPFVGQIADAFPKGRVMLLANLLKLASAVAMLLGTSPLLAYGMIGIGAALYSPAKYGILSQLFGPAALVKANGMLEGSTIAAILLGVLLGGWLADHSLSAAFGGIIGAYAIAALANLFIPKVAAENTAAQFSPWLLVTRFFRSLAILFRHPDSRFSLLGTSVFWGSGTTLRLLLFAWVPVALSITDNQTPANLMGIVSIGIVLGAAAASMWISLASVNRALIGGLLLGPIVLALAGTTSFTTAALLLGGIGFCGGLFVVPLNALLQECGHQTIGAGSALAVQNFSENIAMLLFVGAYSAASSAGMSVQHTVLGFGTLLLAATLAIAAVRLQRRGTA